MSGKNSSQEKTIDKENDGINLHEIIAIFIENKWKIISITGIFTFASLAYALLAAPIYSSNALIQIEQAESSGVLSKLTDIIPDSKPSTQTEIGLLQSRMILGKTVDELGMTTVVNENHLPVIGKGIARLTNKKNGTITISQMIVPDSLLDQPLNLTILSETTYSININNKVINGHVNKPLYYDNISIEVSGIHALPGTSFSVTKLDRLTAIDNVAKNLSVTLQKKDSGLLKLTYQDENPVVASTILNKISSNYLQQNINRKSEEAAQSLIFLEEQLPLIRNQLERSESRLNDFRKHNESVDLSMEAKSVLDYGVSLDSQINEITFKEAEISKLYTRDHPAYRALLEKKALLLQERNKLNARISSMPKTQQEILSLTRDVQSEQEVYMLLLNKQQELNINKASTVGNVRIIDHAISERKPVAPQKFFILAFGFMLGLFSSLMYCIIIKFLHNGIESSEQIEDLDLNVYAAIPDSKWLVEKNEKISKEKKKTIRSVNLLALENPGDLAVEAIRSLRTSLHFGMMQAENNILLISGATPEAGKTFVSCNLAAVIAQSNKKVLLIDADLRKGQAHHIVGCKEKVGLSDILSGEEEFQHVLQKTKVDKFDFISRGKIPPNPSELLMNEYFKKLINWASTEYDFVIIDTPPVLAVSDAHIVAKHAGTNMLVVRHKKNTLKQLQLAKKKFNQNQLTINGAIFNGVNKKTESYYSYGEYK
ncbi:polysaccharide biosynthesis tyrosine autokinase [Enterobacter chuandaensis]|uniref:Polysaccharide biosynthesis tyrosine autokinase n=1 Tax=Enterobacter chuandaensis TaxID=2497875 RepID=A0AA96M6D2_9ENTR|nr:polysaccharide biosynthesis tyrosine autokinase [Enterobacter chuandaensis]MCW4781405.1 polysaccharide biosynthesis tyrosine autokinase [Enterobacter chuandaensis]MDA4759257.1 polysaccharide biosynthesis tyrosine autokinase [Enterobacter chuandaensis]WNS39526.1 polysaccharide biosynthesis tyrosine autokinase [Enterobacter chuandaensis]